MNWFWLLIINTMLLMRFYEASLSKRETSLRTRYNPPPQIIFSTGHTREPAWFHDHDYAIFIIGFRFWYHITVYCLIESCTHDPLFSLIRNARSIVGGGGGCTRVSLPTYRRHERVTCHFQRILPSKYTSAPSTLYQFKFGYFSIANHGKNIHIGIHIHICFHNSGAISQNVNLDVDLDGSVGVDVDRDSNSQMM